MLGRERQCDRYNVAFYHLIPQLLNAPRVAAQRDVANFAPQWLPWRGAPGTRLATEAKRTLVIGYAGSPNSQ
jgi:hypothetical protein